LTNIAVHTKAKALEAVAKAVVAAVAKAVVVAVAKAPEAVAKAAVEAVAKVVSDLETEVARVGALFKLCILTSIAYSSARPALDTIINNSIYFHLLEYKSSVDVSSQ